MTDPVIITKPRLAPLINKDVDLKLQYSGLLRAYQVVSITSTTWYKPGEWLHEDVVNDCCLQKGWKVTMVHLDLIERILSALSGVLKVA